MRSFRLVFRIVLVSLTIFGCSQEQTHRGINPLPNFDALWNYAHPDSSEVAFKEILPLLTHTDEFAIDVQYEPELLTQIARAQGMQGKYDEAFHTLQQADSLLSERTPKAKMRYLLEKGRLLNSSGKTELSIPVLEEAYHFGAEKHFDLYQLDAALLLSSITLSQQKTDWVRKAVQLARTSTDPRCQNQLGSIYKSTAWSYFYLKDYYHAQEMFHKALDWHETNSDSTETLVDRWAIGHCLRALFKFDEALHIQLTLEQDLNNLNLPLNGYVYEEIAELYFAKGNIPQARSYFKKAYDLLSHDEDLTKNTPMRLERIKQLSQ